MRCCGVDIAFIAGSLSGVYMTLNVTEKAVSLWSKLSKIQSCESG